MRAKTDAELAAVAEESHSKGITWCECDVKRLITPYVAKPAVDRVLENVGDDFYHDDVHQLENGCDDNDDGHRSNNNEGDDRDGDNESDDAHPSQHVPAAAVAGEGSDGLAGSDMELELVSACVGEAAQNVHSTISVLEVTPKGSATHRFRKRPPEYRG